MKTSRWSGIFLPLIAFLGACNDSMVAPTLPQQPRSLFYHEAAVGADSRYVCSTALRTADVNMPWRYGRMEVHFPRAEFAPNGATTTYRYEGYNDHGTLVAVATCHIPETDGAIRRMSRILRVHNGHKRSEMAATSAVGLEPLLVRACGPGYDGEYPYCLPNPTGVEVPADESGSGFWEGGSSGEYSPPPDETPPDASRDTVPPGEIPDCTQPQDEDWAQAYCRASLPAGQRLERTRAALAQVAQRGSECARIAQAGSDLLAAGRLRYFPPLPKDFGGWGSPAIGVIVSSNEVDQFGDPARPEAFQAFQRILVHEIEHSLGRDHIDLRGLNTPNSQFCSGH